jgi:uncharacterized protein
MSNRTWIFASDLHGRVARYVALVAIVEAERPTTVVLGGDLLPHGLDRRWAVGRSGGEFLDGFLLPELRKARQRLGSSWPTWVVILGNDDERIYESTVVAAQTEGLWTYAHNRVVEVGGRTVLGYACVPPTPFQLKDWERYDVSRYVDPGCVSPEEGRLTVDVAPDDLRYGTIAKDLESLAGGRDLSDAVVLAHAPPYRTALDRAGLDGQQVDGAPLDVHVGSIALRRFLEDHQPRLGLHGHVHESARLTGRWRDRVGDTPVLTAAHDGAELALIRVDPAEPDAAMRELIKVE